MRIYLEIKTKLHDGNTNSQAFKIEEFERVRTALVTQMNWETVHDDTKFDELVNSMAAQLPADDLLEFVESIHTGVLLKSPRSFLTIGGFTDAGYLRIRIRISAQNNAVLISLGRSVADFLLEYFPNYELSAMLLWERRNSSPLLSGNQSTIKSKTFVQALMENSQLGFPFLISILGISLGFFVSYKSSISIFGDPIWSWYRSLFGPLVMAIVTTTSATLRETRRTLHRFSEWDTSGK